MELLGATKQHHVAEQVLQLGHQINEDELGLVSHNQIHRAWCLLFEIRWDKDGFEGQLAQHM